MTWRGARFFEGPRAWFRTEDEDAYRVEVATVMASPAPALWSSARGGTHSAGRFGLSGTEVASAGRKCSCMRSVDLTNAGPLDASPGCRTHHATHQITSLRLFIPQLRDGETV